jgi:hypothetical protein
MCEFKVSAVIVNEVAMELVRPLRCARPCRLIIHRIMTIRP